MSRSWMPLYVGDYLRDTQHLSATEHGAYLLLIMFYWTHGHLPDDPKELQKISKISPHLWITISPKLEKFFGPKWTHKRIDQELEKSKKLTMKRQVAAQIMHAKHGAYAGKGKMQMQLGKDAHAYTTTKKERIEARPYQDAPVTSASLQRILAMKEKA